MQKQQRNNFMGYILSPLSRFWRNISFRKKTILYTSMILYIFILLFGVLIYHRSTSSIDKISEQSTKQRLQSLDEELKSKLALCSSIASVLLLDRNFQDKLESCPSSSLESSQYDNEIAVYLDSLCASSLLTTSWELYFTYDRPTSFHSRIRSIAEVQNANWYKLITSKGRNTITWSLEPETPDSPSHFICAVGIKNRITTSIPAYFKMSIKLTHVIPSILATSEDLNGVFLLCSQDGTLLWCSKNDGVDYSDYLIPYGDIIPFQSISMDGQSGERIVIPLDGGKYGYTIFYIQDIVSPLNNYMDFSRHFLIVLLLIIILSLLSLVFSARLVDGRIVALTEDISAIDEYNLNYCADMNSLDEIGELSRAFSGLVNRIQKLIEHERRFEEERFELEIQALQAQINPHFLFNTLSIINLLAKEIEADHISEALDALANFYYFSLYDNKKTTTIRTELTMLDSYLTICSIRYRSRLHVQKDVDPQALDCIIPKLIIQPFCENAIFHGFPPSTQKTPEITISIRLNNEDLLIVISDNGKGMSDSQLKHATETGFTITNVNKRIQMFYGEEYGVSISSSPGNGTKACIRLGKSLKKNFQDVLTLNP